MYALAMRTALRRPCATRCSLVATHVSCRRYLPNQAVHTPYDPVPHPAPIVANNTYHAMIERADEWIGRIASMLRTKGMWENTLIVYSSGES